MPQPFFSFGQGLPTQNTNLQISTQILIGKKFNQDFVIKSHRITHILENCLLR